MKGKQTWYTWGEKCDRCGTVYLESGIHSTKKPNIDECDFCIDCYRYLLDNDISYSKTREMYKK